MFVGVYKFLSFFTPACLKKDKEQEDIKKEKEDEREPEVKNM